MRCSQSCKVHLIMPGTCEVAMDGPGHSLKPWSWPHFADLSHTQLPGPCLQVSAGRAEARRLALQLATKDRKLVALRDAIHALEGRLMEALKRTGDRCAGLMGVRAL